VRHPKEREREKNRSRSPDHQRAQRPVAEQVVKGAGHCAVVVQVSSHAPALQRALATTPKMSAPSGTQSDTSTHSTGTVTAERR